MKDHINLTAWGKMPLDVFAFQNPKYFSSYVSHHSTLRQNVVLPTVWVDGVVKQVDAAINKAGNIYGMTFNLRYPESVTRSEIEDDNDAFLNFICHVQNVMTCGEPTELLGWAGCREYDIVTGRKYYYTMLLLDGSVTPDAAVSIVEKIWRVYGKGYIAHPVFRALGPDVENKNNSFIGTVLNRYAIWNNKVKDDFDIVILP